MEFSKKIITTYTVACLMFTPATVFASVIEKIQGGLTTAGKASYGEDASTDLPAIIGSVIGVALGLLGVILLGLLIYGGVLWMIAQGEEKKVKDAKETIKNAIIGLVIVVVAYTLAGWILEQLSGAMSGGSS